MNTLFKSTALALLTLAVSAPCFAASKNLERGIVGPVASNVSWSNYSIVSLIPGAGIIPPLVSTSVFYLGFTAGAQADISNMTLYTTRRGTSKITAVTPITLGGITNPSIDLASPTVCPVVEISANNPCIVRLDPASIALSPLNDYYLVVYFTSDSTNGSLGLTQPTFGQSSLRGTYAAGNLTTGLAMGATFPVVSFSGQPYSLMYVMTN